MIYTFYSYKAGTGQTMALANIAELFYMAGLKVLMVDWDLEAPGLERFFTHSIPPDIILNQSGLIDMILNYQFEDIKRKFTILIDSDENSELRLLPAGRRSEQNFSQYARNVLNFSWSDFYEYQEGERYFEAIRRQFNEMADVVLIDSRSGITEMGGVRISFNRCCRDVLQFQPTVH
jgi:MinD-like ATPase involved in chromosome partitioning or flagellar assembly